MPSSMQSALAARNSAWVARALWTRCTEPLCVMWLSLASCTLLSNFDVHSCDSDAVCTDGSGASRYCEARRCVEGCRDNRQCATADPRFPICNPERGACSALASADSACFVSSGYDDPSMGEFTSATMSLIGAFANTPRSATWLTLQLGARELREIWPNDPSSEGAAGPPLVVLCNDAPQQIDSAMRHLVYDLGTRAIVASFDDTARPTALAGARDGTLLLSPDGSIDAISPAHWHLGGDYRDLQPLYSSLYPVLTRRLALRVAPLARPSRVAVVTGSDEDLAIANWVTGSLTFDGLARPELIEADRLRDFHFSEDPAQHTLVTDRILDYSPDLVLAFTSGRFGDPPRAERATLIADIDAALSTGPGPAPLYLFAPQRAGDTVLDTLAAGATSFRARAVSVDAGTHESSVSSALQTEYAARYPTPLDAEASRARPRIYDALYQLLYASTASAAGEYASSDLRLDILQVNDPEGPLLPVGPAGLKRGHDLLRQNSPIQLLGSTGAGAFDSSRQLRPLPFALACWSEDGLHRTLGRDGTALLGPATAPCAAEWFDDGSG